MDTLRADLIAGCENGRATLAQLENAKLAVEGCITNLRAHRQQLCSDHAERIGQLDAEIADLETAIGRREANGRTMTDTTRRLIEVLREWGGRAQMGDVAKKLGHERAAGIAVTAKSRPDLFGLEKVDGTAYVFLIP